MDQLINQNAVILFAVCPMGRLVVNTSSMTFPLSLFYVLYRVLESLAAFNKLSV